MKSREKILLVIVILAIALFVSAIQDPPEPKEFVENMTVSNYQNLLFNYEIIRYPSNVELVSVSNIEEAVMLGFAIEPWNINFGIIPSDGSYGTRSIDFTNSEEIDRRIILKAYGDISSMVVFSKNDFILKPGEDVSVDVFLYSRDYDAGNYSGEIDVIIKKPIYNFLSII